MHNNYYFLRQISNALKSRITGFTVLSCFSQNKNELIIELSDNSSFFYIRISTPSELCCISFPREFKRSKKNSADLFNEIINRPVTDVLQFENDRSLALSFGDYHLVILLHGNRANVVLYKDEMPLVFFNKKLSRGFNHQLKDFNRSITFSYEAYEAYDFNLKKLIPTFDQTVFAYLETLGFDNKSPQKQWEILTDLLSYFENPSYCITLINKKIFLSLVEVGEIKEKLTDPIEAANSYFQFFTTTFFFHRERDRLLKEYETQIIRTGNFLSKTREKFNMLNNSNEYEEFANIIMANLHSIPLNTKKATLFNFYNNLEISIPLKDTLSPQRNAELYYKKAKNKKLEIENLSSIIKSKERQLIDLNEHYELLKKLSTLKELKIFFQHAGKTIDKSEEEIAPFKRFEFEGYEMLIGKNAKNNDELLQSHTFKDDLWLHAKDVTGSHVILKFKSGNNFPAHVIERAAEIAAYNSKRKTDSHCPVIYTQRKYVRKQKGMAPGAVRVDKENIIMVTPRGF